MIHHILSEFNIDAFAFIPAAECREANGRLHSQMPEGANVVFMLFPYYCGDCEGKISAYGAVHDYHYFAKEVFSALEGYIEKKYPDRFARGFSDHSPYLECEGAAKAGLGIIGKNSLLITEKYSSFVFIGELVTTLRREELVLEGIPEGRGDIGCCEDCGLCERACPAGCAGKKDRESCISSVTQKKGELSQDEISLIKKGGSIWGCDICQKVCPHTKKAKGNGTIETPIKYFKASYIKEDPAEAIIKMDSEEFSRYPFAWRKRATVKRNIEILKDTEQHKND